MVRLMPETAPERLYRLDGSITAWRQLCEHARGKVSETSLKADLAEIAVPQQASRVVLHRLRLVAAQAGHPEGPRLIARRPLATWRRGSGG